LSQNLYINNYVWNCYSYPLTVDNVNKRRQYKFSGI